MKAYKITPEPNFNSCIETNINGVIVWCVEADFGEKITIEILEISEEEYNKLPEYKGP